MAYNPVTRRMEDEFTNSGTQYDFAALARQFGYQGPAGMEDAFVAGLVDARGNPTTGMINQQGTGLPGDIWRSTLTPDTTDYGDSANLDLGKTGQGAAYQGQLTNQFSPQELADFTARSKVSDPGLLSDLVPFLFTGGALGMIGAAGAAGAGAGGAGAGGAGTGAVDVFGGLAGTEGSAGLYGAGTAGTGAAGGLTGGAGAYTIPADVAEAYGAAYGPYAGGNTIGGVTAASVGGASTIPAWLGTAKDILGTGIGVKDVLTGGLQAGLGYLGADAQADAYGDVAQQNLALGAPYRNLLQGSYGQDFNLMNQPGYGDAFDRAADISARSYSAKMGNPANNPTAQAGILSDVWNQSYLPALSNYRGQLGQFGGLGLNTAGAAQMGGAQTAGGAYDALGYGIGTALNPQPDWTKILQGMGGGNQSPYSLNIGGMPYGRR